jgi:hypothetical protein
MFIIISLFLFISGYGDIFPVHGATEGLAFCRLFAHLLVFVTCRSYSSVSLYDQSGCLTGKQNKCKFFQFVIVVVVQ